MRWYNILKIHLKASITFEIIPDPARERSGEKAGAKVALKDSNFAPYICLNQISDRADWQNVECMYVM